MVELEQLKQPTYYTIFITVRIHCVLSKVLLVYLYYGIVHGFALSFFLKITSFFGEAN